MGISIPSMQRRIDSIAMRARTLTSLRKMVGLSKACDISEQHWEFLEKRLSRSQTRILSRLQEATQKPLPHLARLSAARHLNASLGALELEMAKAFVFFDTYMDVLTQRHSPELGPVLRGCDVLARDAMQRDHPALAALEPPLVYCDRGFGASILREGVLLPDGSPNPMPLIQIPYSRLKEKCNLTSVLHEAGHQAMVRLGLAAALPEACRKALKQAGASQMVSDLFGIWMSEIGPDFWGFCASGIAQAATIKEILALPPDRVFLISWGDPHPSPYLRALLTFEWCRQVWGTGIWDGWEKEWLALYPLEGAPGEARALLSEARAVLPIISQTLLGARYRVLQGQRIIDLFNLSTLSPKTLTRVAATARSGPLRLKGLAPCAQLAVFRALKEQNELTEGQMDKAMTQWLSRLGEGRA